MTTVEQAAALQHEERRGLGRARLRMPLPAGTTVDDARAAVASLVERHDVLRSQLARTPTGATLGVDESATPIWSPTSGTTTMAGLASLAVTLERAEGTVVVDLSTPDHLLDLGGLLVLADDLVELSSGGTLDEPVQAGHYAAWQLDLVEAQDAAARLPQPRRPLRTRRADQPVETVCVTFDEVRWAGVVGRARSAGLSLDSFLLGAWQIARARIRDAMPETAVVVDHRAVYEDLGSTAGVLSRALPLPRGLEPEETVGAALAAVDEARTALVRDADTFRWALQEPATFACDSRRPYGPVTFAALRARTAHAREHARLTDDSHDEQVAVRVVHDSSGARLTLTARDAEVPAADLADVYTAVLRELGAGPGQQLRDLDLSAPSGARPAPEPGPATTLVDLFRRQVAATPEAPAVTDCHRTLTYRELAQRADAIADVVRHQPGAGAVVGIAAGRDVDLVASVLGVWSAGAAYVPVDHGWPADRRRAVLAESGAALLLAASADDADEVPTVLLDAIPSAPSADGHGAPDPGAPAYVLFTSGTTGRPKGVVVEHRSVANLVLAHQARIYGPAADGSTAPLRATLTPSLTFDGSVERIGLLAAGHHLVVVDEDTRRDAAAYVRLVRAERIDVVDVTPTFLTLLLSEGLLDPAVHRPRVVVVGGEAIGADLWSRLAESPSRVFNVYGPTETTVNVTAVQVSGHRPTLGEPLAGATVTVRDDRGRCLRAGVAGEVWVGGAGVARGYLGDDELTASRFVVTTDQGRVYRTGDVARLRGDGSLDFLGRDDHQLKVRGVRVEAGEIESLLRAETSVRDAVVRLVGEGVDARLVAWVLVPHGADEDVDLPVRARARLARALPTVAVPAHILPVQTWPTTAGGKIDVDALPLVPQQTARADDPESDTERAVAAIWTELLGTDAFGTQQSFFDVGGHSLIVPVMLRRITDELGVRLPLRTIFTAATVRGLAALVDASRTVDVSVPSRAN